MPAIIIHCDEDNKHVKPELELVIPPTPEVTRAVTTIGSRKQRLLRWTALVIAVLAACTLAVVAKTGILPTQCKHLLVFKTYLKTRNAITPPTLLVTLQHSLL